MGAQIISEWLLKGTLWLMYAKSCDDYMYKAEKPRFCNFQNNLMR